MGKYVKSWENFHLNENYEEYESESGLDSDLLELLQEIFDKNYEVSEEDSNTQGRSRVYKIESESSKLLFWNSSNGSGFDKSDILFSISSAILKGDLEGRVSSDFNEIMWEVLEK